MTEPDQQRSAPSTAPTPPRERRPNRHRAYDYSLPGAYFITICTLHRIHLLANIVDDGVKVNPFGEIVTNCWHDLPNHYRDLELDAFVVMPNHVHGIVILNDLRPDDRKTLSEIVRALKSYSAKRINHLRGTPGVPVWQRSFFDRIIRNEREMDSIRWYIDTNPAHWHEDKLNEPDGVDGI